jgi:hypothetical protein
MPSHGDDRGGKIRQEGDLTCAEGVRHEELIEVLTREDRRHSAGVGEVGRDGGLVVQFVDIEVDETRWATVMGWRDT